MNTARLSRGLAVAAACFIASAFPARGSGSFQLVSVKDPALDASASGGGLSAMPITSSNGRYVVFASTAQNLTSTTNTGPSALYTGKLNVYLRDLTNETTTLVSLNLGGLPSNSGDSIPSGISTNGQYVLFESSADDLVPFDVPPTNVDNYSAIFMRDLVHGTTTLVSVSTGGAIGNGASRNAAMTPDGRYVAFVSEATNLVAGDTNGIADVFVRDLIAGTTTLVSVGAMPVGTASPASFSETPDITPDGRYVAFFSTATNLVPGVTNSEVYVRDLVGGTTTWVSTNEQAIFLSVYYNSNSIACNPIISTNGQYIAYEACADPVSGVNAGLIANGVVVRYNLQTGLTNIVAVNAIVPVAPPYQTIGGLDMSPDGRFIAFVGTVYPGISGIYLWDAQSGSASLVSVSFNGQPPSGILCDWPSVTPDGRYVSFISTATNLTANAVTGATNAYHLYIRDMLEGVTTLASVNTNGQAAAVDSISPPSHLSDDGQLIAFESADQNLAPDEANRDYDVFAFHLSTSTTELISVRQSTLPSIVPNGYSRMGDDTCVSTNGRYVVFASSARNLIPNDTNGTEDIFVQDLLGGTNELVSSDPYGNPGNAASGEPTMSGDGRYVAFSSWTTNLAAGIPGGSAEQILLRDLLAGTNTLISVSPNGGSPGNANSDSPTISTDGRFVLFRSLANNLTSIPYYGVGIEDILLRDVQAGTNYFLNTNMSYFTKLDAMTPDGRRVVYSSAFPNAICVWDSLQAGPIYTNNSFYNNGTFTFMAISPGGHRYAYVNNFTNLYAADFVLQTNVVFNPTNSTYSTNLTVTSQTNWFINSGLFTKDVGLRFSGDGQSLVYAMAPFVSSLLNPNGQNVYVFDFDSGTNLLVNQGWTTNSGNTPSMDPDISPDGHFVAYRTFASNSVYGNFDNVPQVVVYDQSNNATILMSVNQWGNSTPNQRSSTAVFSGDSQTLVLQSWGSDQLPGDYNQSGNIYAVGLGVPSWLGANPTNSAFVFPVNIVPPGGAGPGSGQGPTITWPAALRQSYNVQFKNDLTDPVWQDLPGNISVMNSQGAITDASATNGTRFYRIVLNQ